MIRFENVSKIYRTGRGEVKALDEINFHARKGEFLVVRGPSGSGKTTLLLCLGGMLRPTKGRIIVGDDDLSGMNERERAAFRARNIGFVFQLFHLVPYLNVTENVLLSSGVASRGAARMEVGELLSRLGLTGRAYHKPSELSAGERQRVAMARALLNRPQLILADEPTGNLDPDNAAEVVQYLEDFHQDGGTVVVVTHGQTADRYADRIIYLREGRITQSSENQ